MTLLRKTFLLRLLIAALLLVVAPDVSKIVCISPTGHNDIEDWAALCCPGSAGTPDSAFSKATPCQGCTDYPFTSTIEIKSSQQDSSRGVSFENSSFAVAAPVRLDHAAASVRLALSLERQADPVNSPPLTTSLRC